MSASLGPPAPWAQFSKAQRRITKSQMLEAVRSYSPIAPEAVAVDGRQPSAILVPIAGGEEAPEVIFTRRAWHLRSHTGEISFPGGRFEAGDADLEATALRETHEEIGLLPTSVDVVGELDRLVTVSSPALIVPFVGLLQGSPRLVAAPDEVDALITVTLEELLDPKIYRSEIWQLPDGTEFELSFFELVGDTLWGATARMVRNLLEVVLHA